MEVGPLVKGVPHAVHQSFSSEEEARSVFALASSKGHTRIVSDHRQHTSPHSSPIFRDRPSSQATVSAQGAPNSKKSFRPEPGFNLHPVSYSSSEPARKCSLPTASDRPYNNGKKPAGTEHVPIETGVSKEDTRAPTPQLDPIKPPPSLRRSSPSPRVIVKTPSWLASYPKSPQPLSPLDRDYLSLNNFRTGGDQGMNFKSSSSGSSICRTRNSKMSTISPQSKGPVGRSSICFSPPMHSAHIIHEQDKDPRSPMLSQTKVPVSGPK